VPSKTPVVASVNSTLSVVVVTFVSCNKTSPPPASAKLKTPDEFVCKNLSFAGAVDGKVKV
jgi:hypothetical protein